MRFASRGELEVLAIAVEGPRLALLDDLEVGLVVAEQETVTELPARRAVGERQDVATMPARVDDRDGLVGHDTTDEGALGQLLQCRDPCHLPSFRTPSHSGSRPRSRRLQAVE